MGMSSGGGKGPLSEINVTPLVDVMLVLLIIFMVSAPMMTTGLDVDLPNTRAPRLDMDEEKLLLTVTKEQQVFLGEVEVPYDKLEQALTTNERLQREKELYIQADEAVPYGFVAKVMALIRRGGIEKVGLVTDPLGSEEAPTEAPAAPTPDPRSGPPKEDP
ncbi:MAG: biopolymer transporter ExbD [Myxococcales bacterium]|nr:biopolymer transporter ExbD [Myxococcales bacterium]